jgi:NAD+ diphosphatase
MLCSHCRERYYPQIAPCIIVAIRRDDKILLAQHTRHRNGVYTVLAGLSKWAKRWSRRWRAR